MKWILCLTAAVLLAGGGLWSSPADAGDFPQIIRSEDFRKLGVAAFSFMNVTQGARTAAMGDAFSSVANDINAIFFNPAGLALIKRASYTFSYTRWLVDTAFYNGAVAYNTTKGVIGISLLNYDVGEMEVRTIYNPGGTGEKIKSGANAIGVAYAWKATDRLGLGLKATYVSETLHQDQITATVLDVGTYFFTGFRSSRIALSMRNFGPDTKVVGENQKFLMPMNFDVGAAMEVYGKQGDPTYLTVSFASVYSVDFEQRWNFGTELWMANVLAVRGGYKVNYDEESWSIGAGFKGTFGDRSVMVDLSYSDFGPFLDAPIRLSVGGAF